MNSLACGVRHAAAWLLCLPALAGAQTIPSDEDSYKGDHVRLLTNVKTFEPLNAGADATTACAPAGSRMSVSDQDVQYLYVRFIGVASESDLLKLSETALADCPSDKRVNTHTDYRVRLDAFRHSDVRRSGVSFGALVVPFKLRLGKDKQLVSSSTVAPFVGFRTAWLTFGLTFTPVLALGLSNVPVTNPATGTTETKAAYTAAAGFRVTSSKNDKFNAGLLLGHDFLNKSDRASDNTVGKPWLSIYLGYAI